MISDILTHEFMNRLRGFIRKRVRSDADADDALQDVMLRFVEHGENINPDSIIAWLFTVARRVIVDRARAASSLAPVSAVAIESMASDTTDASVMQELAHCVEPLLADLDAVDRTLLQRIDLAGESQLALAREFDLPASTVKSRVQRARTKLLGRLHDCCAIEHDALGKPIDYRHRPDAPCRCDDEGCASRD